MRSHRLPKSGNQTDLRRSGSGFGTGANRHIILLKSSSIVVSALTKLDQLDHIGDCGDGKEQSSHRMIAELIASDTRGALNKNKRQVQAAWRDRASPMSLI
jgi:hypothetical protein